MKLKIWLGKLIDFYICMKENELKIDIFKIERSETMTNMEKEELTSRIKGLGEEEMELVANIIPVDLCLKRIGKELDKLKSVENWMDKASKMLE